MCLECGFYKGRMVVDMEAKRKAREARLEEKRARIEGEQADYGEPKAEEQAAAIEPAKTEKTNK
jgi:hypothetical protein